MNRKGLVPGEPLLRRVFEFEDGFIVDVPNCRECGTNLDVIYYSMNPSGYELVCNACWTHWVESLGLSVS